MRSQPLLYSLTFLIFAECAPVVAVERCDVPLGPRPSISAAKRKVEAFEINFAFGSIKYGLTVSIRTNETARLQLVEHHSHDAHVEGAFVHAVTREFGGEIRGRRTKTLEIKGYTRDEIVARMKRVREHINAAFVEREKVETILHSDKADSRSVALHEVMLDFLGRSTHRNPEAYRSAIDQIHRAFLASLSPRESSYFDYRIFDEFPGYAVERKGLALDRTRDELGTGEQADYQAVHEALRARLVELARPFDSWEARQNEVVDRAARHILDWHSRRSLELPAPFDLLERTDLPLEERIELIRWAARQPYSPVLSPADLDLLNANFQYEPASRKLALMADNRHPYVEIDEVAHYLPSVPELRKVEMPPKRSTRDRTREAFHLAGGRAVEDTYVINDGLFESAETVAAADVAIEEEINDPTVIRALHAAGIRRVFELTRYSAQDYFDKFRFDLPTFERLLDELNAAGIHLHFEARWDRRTYRLRRRRREFYEFKHVPSRYVDWDP